MYILPEDQGVEGIGHTKEECRTYKKEKKDKAKVKKAKAEEDSESEEEGVTVCMIRVGKVRIKSKGWFQFDTGTSHHTTNQLDLLRGSQYPSRSPRRQKIKMPQKRNTRISTQR